MNIQRARATSRIVLLTLMLAAFFFIDNTRMSHVWMGTLLTLLGMIEAVLLMADAVTRSGTPMHDWVLRGDPTTTPVTEPVLVTYVMMLTWSLLGKMLIS